VAPQRTKAEALDVLEEIATVMDCGLDRQALDALVELVEAGVSPEALVAVVEELRKEKAEKNQSEAS